MAGGGGLLRLWSEWGIQIMVLLSFALQVLLLACGGTRRHSSSTVLRIVLWLTYLSADSTAIYTLGRLSVANSSCRSRSREHLLVAFWAPFLLLHLGGPDNITAYALEDNRLWLRHLQTLAVQALGAAYVVYKFIFSARSHDGSLLLLAASISMYAAGLAKYGERVWALRCGNISNISSSFDKSDGNVRDPEPLNRLPMDRGEIGNEEILLRAHSHFDICKGAFTDATVKHNSLDGSKYTVSQLYKLVEMELSLMYDILYTKVAVIHTWYGFCIHCISLLGTVATFLLFQLSISSRRDGYNPVDVVISYVLLAGALIMDATSLCKAILSSWTCFSLYNIRLKRLPDAITYLRWHVRWPAKRRLWSSSIGQYNLLDMSVSNRNGIMFWLAKMLGLQHWWNELRFSDTFFGNEFCSMEDLKVVVWKEMLKKGTEVNSRGSSALQDNSCAEYKWSVDNIDLDSSILVWHIVTDLVIRLPRNDEKVDKRLAEVTKVLSNYMMFLLVVKPDMLPGHIHRNLYLNACKELNRYWSDCLKEWSQWEQETETESRQQVDMLANWLLGDLYHKLQKNDPSSVEIKLRENDPSSNEIDIEGHGEEEAPEHAKDVYNAIWIYESLRSKPRDKVRWLETIFQVWMEMIMYVAEHCSRDSHARQLSDGGEFITIMWLMVRHLS